MVWAREETDPSEGQYQRKIGSGCLGNTDCIIGEVRAMYGHREVEMSKYCAKTEFQLTARLQYYWTQLFTCLWMHEWDSLFLGADMNW